MRHSSIFAGISFLAVDIKRRMQFSIATFGLMISSLVMFVIQISLWGYIGLGDDPSYVVRYFALVVFIRPIVNLHVEREIEGIHASGGIIYDIVRPISLYNTLFLRSSSRAVVAFLTVSLPIMIVIALFFDLGSIPFQMIPLLFVSICLGYSVAFSIAFIVGLSVFRLKDANGIMSAHNFLFPFFAGAVIPIDALPYTLRRILYVLPFRTAYDLPIKVANAGNLSNAFNYIIIQFGWALTLLLIARFMQVRNLRRLEIYGG